MDAKTHICSKLVPINCIMKKGLVGFGGIMEGLDRELLTPPTWMLAFGGLKFHPPSI
jgi:hypothetical protein